MLLGLPDAIFVARNLETLAMSQCMASPVGKVMSSLDQEIEWVSEYKETWEGH